MNTRHLLRPALVFVLAATGAYPTTGRSDDLESSGLLGSRTAELRERIEALSDSEWQVREDATLWLMRHYASWIRSVPASWSPSNPEARWRWQRVQKTVHHLANLPNLLNEEPLDDLRRRGLKLYFELGPVYVDAIAECLSNPAANVRQGAIELLSALPDIELRPHLRGLERDPSPWVRSRLYEIAQSIDPVWAQDLLRRAIRRHEPESVTIEVVRAMRRTRAQMWGSELRALWTNAGPELKEEVALAIASCPRPDDRHIFLELLASGRYPSIVAALPPLERFAEPADMPELVDLLPTMEPELAVRLQSIITERGDARCGLSLLPLLHGSNANLRRFAAETLTRWEAEDFYGDVAIALNDIPPEQRFLAIVAVEDSVSVVPAPATLDSAQPVPALRPRGHTP